MASPPSQKQHAGREMIAGGGPMFYQSQSPIGQEGDETRRSYPSNGGFSSERDPRMNTEARQYYQLNGLTMRLADKERKIADYDKQIKDC